MRFFQADSTNHHAGTVVGDNSLKKPHHIIILQFSEVVKGHDNYRTILLN